MSSPCRAANAVGRSRLLRCDAGPSMSTTPGEHPPSKRAALLDLSDLDARGELRRGHRRLRGRRPRRDRDLGAEAAARTATTPPRSRRSSRAGSRPRRPSPRSRRFSRLPLLGGPDRPAGADRRALRIGPSPRRVRCDPRIVCLTGTGRGLDPDEARRDRRRRACERSRPRPSSPARGSRSSPTRPTAGRSGRSRATIPRGGRADRRCRRLTGARPPVRRLAPLEQPDRCRRRDPRDRPHRRRAHLRRARRHARLGRPGAARRRASPTCPR